MRETYSAETQARHVALVEETIGQKSNSRDGVDYGKNIVELERTVSWSMVRLQIGGEKCLGRRIRRFKWAVLFLKTQLILQKERESNRDIENKPHAYAIRKRARELCEPILPKTPYPPENQINYPLHFRTTQIIPLSIFSLERKHKRKLTTAPTERANVPNISDKGTSPPYAKTKSNFHYIYIHRDMLKRGAEREREYLHLPRKSIINSHDSHGSNTKARHNSGYEISEPLRSLPGQPLCHTYGWDLRIHTTRVFRFEILQRGISVLVLHDHTDSEACFSSGFVDFATAESQGGEEG